MLTEAEIKAYTMDIPNDIQAAQRASGCASAPGSAFMQGYVCAVAEIIRTHDEPTVAKDVLRGIGNVNWDCIDDYDKETLQKAGIYTPNAKLTPLPPTATMGGKEKL